jgi:hypothetical protein
MLITAAKKHKAAGPILDVGCGEGYYCTQLAAAIGAELTGIDISKEAVRCAAAKYKTADWLCADEAELDQYLADPLIRKDLSAGLFWELLGSMKRTGNVDTYHRWNKEMPIYLMYGTRDAVGDFGKGVQQVYNQMKKAGLSNVEFEQYIDGRHDILHEELGCAEFVCTLLQIGWISCVANVKKKLGQCSKKTRPPALLKNQATWPKIAIKKLYHLVTNAIKKVDHPGLFRSPGGVWIAILGSICL